MPSLLTFWHLDGMMTVFLLTVCFGYFYLTGFKISNKSGYFFTGFLLMVLSIASPLYFLGENYLMSAHMLSHVILLLIAAPLMVIGIPENMNHPALNYLSEKMAKSPWVAWLAGVVIMWFWHIPAIFNSLIENNYSTGTNNGFYFAGILGDLHLISLVLAGVLFSWPIAGPIPSGRLTTVKAVLYLSTACIFCSILGLLITFAPEGVYTGYVHAEDHFGFLKFIRNESGLTPVIDQEIAGLIMWVPGCFIYLSASVFLLFDWFRGKKENPFYITHNPL